MALGIYEHLPIELAETADFPTSMLCIWMLSCTASVYIIDIVNADRSFIPVHSYTQLQHQKQHSEMHCAVWNNCFYECLLVK